MKEPLTVQGIVDLASAFYSSAVLFAAIDCGVFDAVRDLGADAGAAKVASSCGASPRGMRLLLDACVACGLLAKNAQGVYSNTPASATALVKGSPADLTGAIRYNRDVYPVWGRLAGLVKTGRPPEDPSAHLGGDAARTGTFAAAMYGRAMGIGRSVVPMLDLGADCRRVLDLAGGPGAYAILMAQSAPQIDKIVTVDLPAISEFAAGMVAKAGLSGKIECRAGDYRSDVYESGAYDAVTVFGALHQESPEDAAGILKRAADALRPGGRIYVLDMMTDASRTDPPFSALFAVNMALTMPNGWVFSDAELKEWLAAAGFKDAQTRAVPPPMPHWLVSALKKQTA